MITVEEAGTALRDATGWFVRELGRADDGADLTAQAGPLEWSCWTTLDHVADCQLAYALQLASGAPDDYVRVNGAADTEDFVHFTRDLGVRGVRAALAPFAELLRAQALVARAEARAFHPYGTSDASGFAAMGTVEMLLHGHDVLTGLGLACDLPEKPAAAVLRRLFPDTEPHEAGPGATLLWATGRGALPGREPVTAWRWDGRVR